MARQLILLSCLAAVAFSTLNCYYNGPSSGGKCTASVYDQPIGSACYRCVEGQLPGSCYQVGPAAGNKCPSTEHIIVFGLGKAIDPFTTGICTKCGAGR